MNFLIQLNTNELIDEESLFLNSVWANIFLFQSLLFNDLFKIKELILAYWAVYCHIYLCNGYFFRFVLIQ